MVVNISVGGSAVAVDPLPFGAAEFAASAGGDAIGTRPGGQSDMIESGVSGLLVPAGDAGALAEAMQLLLEDEGLRERMGAIAKVQAQRFTASEIFLRFARLYSAVAWSHDGSLPRDLEP